MSPALPVTRIFCIGRNYAEHAKELNNPLPERPVIFMKPASSLVPPGNPIHMPRHGKTLHQEAEIVLQIAHAGRAHCKESARAMIHSLGLGLDLTLRDLQNELKAQGLPWEIAKSFDASATLAPMVPYLPQLDLANLRFSCSVNGHIRQVGHSKDMLFSIEQLIIAISEIWTLVPGDLIYTGTPKGVGPLEIGDQISVNSTELGQGSWTLNDSL